MKLFYLPYKSLWTLILLLLALSPEVEAQCTIAASSSGFNAAYTQVYVLVDAQSGIILAENGSGTFPGTPPGIYQVHALNYNPADPPNPLPSDLIGQALSLVGSIQSGCYNADFLSDYQVEVCSSCSQSSTICETDPLVVSSSGGNSSYTQLYVLVDASTGIILSTSSSGSFTGLLSAGNSYRVYALNYNPADPPAPLPGIGQSVAAVGTVIQGCYNTDYLSDYICFNVTDCTSPCVLEEATLFGTDIIASSSGGNSSYIQVYVLADEFGNFVAQNSTGIFPTGGLMPGALYHVHALNYNPADPPSTLPSDLSPGDPISDIGGGCFNDDFLTDIFCAQMIPNILLDLEEYEFRGEKLQRANSLMWLNTGNSGLSHFEIERKSNEAPLAESIANIEQGSGSYSFRDENPPMIAYYRLVEIGISGVREYSDWIVLDRSYMGNTQLKAYPNPTTGLQQLEIQTDRSGQARITIRSTYQTIVMDFVVELQRGLNSFDLDLSTLASGVYFISASKEGKEESIRIMKW